MNQKPAVRAYSLKAANKYLVLYLNEYCNKYHLLSKITRNAALMKNAALRLKNHMRTKNFQVKRLTEDWEKIMTRKWKVWEKDIRKACDKFQLGQFVPVGEHYKLMSR